jgi:O-antigen/teichoic acid export membrane protein
MDVPTVVTSQRMTPEVVARPSLRASARATWYRHQDLLKSVLYLLATTGLTSLLGLGYWAVASRLFSQRAVGYGTAAIAALTLVSSVGIFGLGTLLIGDLPKRRNRAGLISAAMLAAGTGSFVLAVAFVLVAPHFTTRYDDIDGSVGAAGVFCIGVALTAMSAVFDAAAIGILRGGLQLMRNMVFVVVKLLTLIGVALVIHYTSGIGLFASWIAAIPVSLLVVAIRLRIARAPVLARPDWSSLRKLAKVLVAHNWLNLALQIPSLVVPVIVASMLSPEANAAYYVTTAICTGLYILPMHMATALFAVASGDPKAIARKLRFALRVSLAVGIPGVVVLAGGAHFILSLFGPGYARIATLPMQLIALSSLPVLVGSYYVSVSRATGRLSRAAAVMTTFGAVNAAGTVIGTMRGGLIGMATATLALSVIEAAITTPTVVRAALGSGRHRRLSTELTEVEAVPATGVATEEAISDRLARHQQASLALLISMASPATLGSHPFGGSGTASGAVAEVAEVAEQI